MGIRHALQQRSDVEVKKTLTASHMQLLMIVEACSRGWRHEPAVPLVARSGPQKGADHVEHARIRKYPCVKIPGRRVEFRRVSWRHMVLYSTSILTTVW